MLRKPHADLGFRPGMQRLGAGPWRLPSRPILLRRLSRGRCGSRGLAVLGYPHGACRPGRREEPAADHVHPAACHPAAGRRDRRIQLPRPTGALAAIRRAGGLALVQDPCDALFPSMPRAAIEAADPQFTGPAPGLARHLCRWVAQREQEAAVKAGTADGRAGPGRAPEGKPARG
ncbi:MAG: chemotaxis protein CheB [Streptosporangiales bacterium]